MGGERGRMGGCHGMQTREFRCYCGRLNRWPAFDYAALRRVRGLLAGGYRAGSYAEALVHLAIPLHELVCFCGRRHRRVQGGGYVFKLDRAVGMPGCLGWSDALARRLEQVALRSESSVVSA